VQKDNNSAGAYLAGITRALFPEDDKQAFAFLVSLFRPDKNPPQSIKTPKKPRRFALYISSAKLKEMFSKRMAREGTVLGGNDGDVPSGASLLDPNPNADKQLKSASPAGREVTPAPGPVHPQYCGFPFGRKAVEAAAEKGNVYANRILEREEAGRASPVMPMRGQVNFFAAPAGAVNRNRIFPSYGNIPGGLTRDVVSLVSLPGKNTRDNRKDDQESKNDVQEVYAFHHSSPRSISRPISTRTTKDTSPVTNRPSLNIPLQRTRLIRETQK